MSITKQPIRLIALDMDGTLLNDDHDISLKNQQAIKEALNRGIEVVISTGRHYTTSHRYAEMLGINYLITVNGSETWRTTGEMLDRQLLDTDLVEMLIRLKHKHQTSIWMTATDRVWQDEIPEDITQHQWLKFGFNTDDHTIKQEITNQLSLNKRLELSNSSPTNIEVNAAGINKAVAISKLSEQLGIRMDQVMAVGDSLNDIKMIEAAGIGVAMGNAQPLVKETADKVTKDNNNEGVASAIKQWVLTNN
ncbi:Cof-type HAD-IIB family hydrolase [Aquibacillus kalidii]|uniref:Cof-type HAD-IIB family hydrolase n=1 Tax=Aquibacillus kalidii TaxID=2762597 RepID=UPI001647AE9E|nr:Cof-type HAD-IIB family hydrolase [Aquibacillus kalidii]